MKNHITFYIVRYVLEDGEIKYVGNSRYSYCADINKARLWKSKYQATKRGGRGAEILKFEVSMSLLSLTHPQKENEE